MSHEYDGDPFALLSFFFSVAVAYFHSSDLAQYGLPNGQAETLYQAVVDCQGVSVLSRRKRRILRLTVILGLLRPELAEGSKGDCRRMTQR